MYVKTDRDRHDKSLRLESYENEQICKLVESENGLIMSTAIIQLYLCTNLKEWAKHSTGIVCLVKDFSKKSHFFRLYNLEPKLIWEDEVYTYFMFCKVNDYFYYYPGKTGNVGFNFAFLDEASKFFFITKRIASLITKYELRELKSRTESSQSKLKRSKSISSTASSTFSIKSDSASIKSDKKKHKHVKNLVISAPTDFKVITHVEKAKNFKGYEIEANQNSEIINMLEEILKHLDIKPNKESLEYADKLIQSNGGYNKFSKVYRNSMMEKKKISNDLSHSRGETSLATPKGNEHKPILYKNVKIPIKQPKSSSNLYYINGPSLSTFKNYQMAKANKLLVLKNKKASISSGSSQSFDDREVEEKRTKFLFQRSISIPENSQYSVESSQRSSIVDLNEEPKRSDDDIADTTSVEDNKEDVNLMNSLLDELKKMRVYLKESSEDEDV